MPPSVVDLHMHSCDSEPVCSGGDRDCPLLLCKRGFRI